MINNYLFLLLYFDLYIYLPIYLFSLFYNSLYIYLFLIMAGLAFHKRVTVQTLETAFVSYCFSQSI